MSKHFNDFCRYCTGNKYKDIKRCEDTDCVFHPFRFGGLEPEIMEEVDAKFTRRECEEGKRVPTKL